MSFSFLLSILACCISAFVTVNRFGFALNGAMCAFDRIYYDTLNGKLKKNGEKWEGLKNTTDILGYIKDFCSPEIDKNKDNFIIESCNELNELYEGKKLIDNLIDFIPNSDDFQKNIKDRIKFSYFHDKYKPLYAFLKVISMIFYCLLSIVTTAAGVSMMFYACLKRQGYLITFMHIIWNIIRFFIVSFFLYGTAYGVFFLILKDLISCVNKIFGTYLIEVKSEDMKKEYTFLHNCLFPEKDGTTLFLDQRIKDSIIYYISSKTVADGCVNEKNKDSLLCRLYEKVKSETLGSFDCSFLKGDLNHIYKALYDASSESQYLCALCLCSSFFGAITIYFYLLVMHHYNNEIFFDSGKSIFTGFDGFGRGYKKKNRELDPSYKKRKLRAEIELTSKNEEQDEYNDFNRNEDN